MKSTHILLLLFASLLLSVPTEARNMKGDTLSTTYAHFSSQKGMVVHKGFYTVYKLGNQYFLEIPKNGLDKDVLITAQVVKGTSNYVSDACGVINFSKGKGNNLYLMRHYALDVSSDSTDFCMMNSIIKSGMRPIESVYPLVTVGPSGSYIIEITKDLNMANGLFSVSSNSSLSHPDPALSSIDGVRMIPQGVAFQVTRSQIDNVTVSQDGKKADMAYTFGLEFVFQQLSEHRLTMKEAQPAFGFETISRTEYDTKQYLARQKEYILRWLLSASKSNLNRQRKGLSIRPEEQICIYVDPITPKPFVECIQKAVKQWECAFLKAGWKDVFRFSSDDSDASLSYRHILFRWGYSFSGIHSSKIYDPVSGEILAARINIVDAVADDQLSTYFLQCGDVDNRILSDIHSLDVRKDVFTAQIASAFGEVLGMKSNKSGYTVFGPEQLRSNSWLQQNGITASITGGVTFNFMARPQDGIAPANLFPRVSTYDWDAIRYAYGNGSAIPSLKSSFYTAEDKLSPYAQQGYLSNNILESAISGIDNIKKVYAELNNRINRLPADQNKWSTVSELTVKALVLYQSYLTQINSLVGGRVNHPIIKGVNEVSTTFVPRVQQVEALQYLENHIYNEAPQWVMRKDLKQATGYDFNDMMMGLAVVLYKHYIDKDVIQLLIDSENQLGNNAFTTKDLFAYLDRVIFENFNNTKAVPSYKQGLQLTFINYLASTMAKNNLSGGLSNEANTVLHNYFIETANKIITLSKTHTDEKTRASYALMVIRMNKEYFNK